MGLVNIQSNKFKVLVVAVLFLWQSLFPIVPFINTDVYAAAGDIDVSTHQGQYTDGTWSTGSSNIKGYSELEDMNFRFTISSSVSASGLMQIEYSGNEAGCNLFFQQDFSISSIDNISGDSPTVVPYGTAYQSGDDWVQPLEVDFSVAGEARVVYTLTLSSDAGECSSGAPQHARLANITDIPGTIEDESSLPDDFKNIGNENVPIPANEVIELPEIFVEKWVDENGDGVVDRVADASEWSFSLDGGPAVETDSNGQVVFENVTPDGNHIVTELNGPSDQSFLDGSGTNCTFIGGVATANVVSGTEAQDATCIFNNGLDQGSLTIVKDVEPNSDQVFNFTVSGTGLSNFSLIDDGVENDNSNSKTFSGLVPGSFTVTETEVSGWSLTSLVCDTDDYSSDDNELSVSVSAGENVTCTFTNTEHGNLVVNKTTLPTGDNTVFNVNASGNNTIFTTASQTISDGESVNYDVLPGTYSVEETVPTGWTLTTNTCEDVEIAAGQTVECSLVNTKNVSLTIVKDSDPNDSQDFLFNISNQAETLDQAFSLDDDSDETLPNFEEFTGLLPGTFTVTENVDALSDWDLSSIDCGNFDFSPVTNDNTNVGLTIALEAGESATCTFTNSQRGSISGVKYEANADSTTLDSLAGWTINLLQNDQIVSTTTTDENGFYSFDNLISGIYDVQEVLEGGWTQIFAPSQITLDTGENDIDNDFGNFSNGSISGFKFNDFDGDGVFDESEEKLSDWEITLYHSVDEDGLFDDGEASVFTDVDGEYSFTDLEPGKYKVCETPQENWNRTFPAESDCHIVDILTSNKNVTDLAFGNRGLGTITVIKNVDTDGNGEADEFDVSDWTWTIDGVEGEFNTGSSNSEEVFAGTYTVNENQQSDYHLASVECSGEDVTQSTSVSVTVSTGEDVICTFVNQRDTGEVKIVKLLDPVDDDGNFDFYLDDELVIDDASHNDSTTVQVATGEHQVSEFAGTDTNLDDYDASYECRLGESVIDSGDSTLTNFFSVSSDETVVCTFTNTRKATINIVKVTEPGDSEQSFDFSGDLGEFTLDDNSDDTYLSSEQFTVSPGDYTVVENVNSLADWDLTDLDCGDYDFNETDEGNGLTVSLGSGENVTCTFTNTQRGTVTLEKILSTVQTDEFEFEFESDITELDGPLTASIFTNNEVTAENILPGEYSIEELATDGWDLTNIFCSDEDNTTVDLESSLAQVVVDPGENITCTFVNTQRADIVVTKYHDVNQNGVFDADSESTLEGWEIVLDESESDNPMTDENGQVLYENVEPGLHSIDEVLQEGWIQSAVTCNQDEQPEFEAQLVIREGFFVQPGETLECFIGNYQELVLEISKTNDQVDTASIGDIVTYTLVVTNPEDSGVSENTQVTDLPPENFEYIPGTYTASSSVRGDIKLAGTTTEPTYASPGQWELDTMMPGEVVTLTYQTLITSDTTPGEYPDIAFVQGVGDTTTEQDAQVLGNVHISDDPFVGTEVSIAQTADTDDVFTAEVLGVSTTVPSTLPNTGGSILSSFYLSLMVAAITYFVELRRKYRMEVKS